MPADGKNIRQGRNAGKTGLVFSSGFTQNQMIQFPSLLVQNAYAGASMGVTPIRIAQIKFGQELRRCRLFADKACFPEVFEQRTHQIKISVIVIGFPYMPEIIVIFQSCRIFGAADDNFLYFTFRTDGFSKNQTADQVGMPAAVNPV